VTGAVERLARARRMQRAAWAETFQPVLEDLRNRVRQREPAQVAAASGAVWDPDAGSALRQAQDAACEQALHLACLGDAFRVSWPELVAYADVEPDQPCGPDLQGLILYYLALADGTPPAGRWIAFRELPDGWLYHQAFQSYTGDELVRAWGNDLDAFANAAARLQGRAIEIGDVGFAFDLLPRVSVAVVYWAGDEEFPPNAQVLFDAAASHYLTTDGLAVLGHHLMHRLLED
jgi:hypothetical protein